MSGDPAGPANGRKSVRRPNFLRFKFFAVLTITEFCGIIYLRYARYLLASLLPVDFLVIVVAISLVVDWHLKKWVDDFIDDIAS